MLLGPLDARLLENLLTSKGTIQAGKKQLEQAGIFNAVSSLINFEIQKYYQNTRKFNGVHSRNNLSKI